MLEREEYLEILYKLFKIFYCILDKICNFAVTPHVGVWIEISATYPKFSALLVTPHVGVWIEIVCFRRVPL